MIFFSRTVVDGWIVLQVAIRNDPGVNIDYKVAQNEGESELNTKQRFFLKRERIV
jgi:hypothetical protein